MAASRADALLEKTFDLSRQASFRCLASVLIPRGRSDCEARHPLVDTRTEREATVGRTVRRDAVISAGGCWFGAHILSK